MQQGFPGQVTTATTSQQSSGPMVRLDLEYIRTGHGVVKIAEIILNLLGFMCVLISNFSSHSRSSWFNTVSMTGFWATGILLAFYLYHIIEKFNKIPWSKIEFIYCTVMAILYLIMSCLIANLAKYSESLGIASFFGFCAMCAYGFDGWLNFKLFKSGESSQGHAASKTASPATSPAAY